MSTLRRVTALRSERDALVEFCRGLTPEEWAAPSRCSGWSVQDVVGHMGAAFHGTFGPWVIKLIRTNDLEANNDSDADRRRSWSPAAVLDEYEKWSSRFISLQRGLLQRKPLASVPIRLGELGRYPARLLASAMTFDHHVHLRFDLATALDRPVSPSDPERMAVLLEWMWAGLPFMARDELSWLDRSVTLTLLGEGAGTWSVVPGPAGMICVHPGAVDDAAASVTADADGFPVWATRRQSWRDADLKVDGDEDLGARFLDAFRVV